MKNIVWLGDSYKTVLSFPKDARREVGYNLDRVQRGLAAADMKSMKGVGVGVLEIRIHVGSEYRIFYVAKFAEAVYVLHAAIKKTCKTAKQDLELIGSDSVCIRWLSLSKPGVGLHRYGQAN